MSKKGNGMRELASECLFIALLKLMDEKPYQSISITEICDKAGVSRMAYYRNYNSKEEILTKHAEMIVEGVKKEIIANPGDIQIWQNIYEYLSQHNIFYKLSEAGLIQYFSNLVKELVFFVQKEVMHKDINDEKVQIEAYVHMGLYMSLIFYTIDTGKKLDLQEMLKQAKTSLI
ncbi:MAG: TetR/AcrR family transcriptional regulator [Bacilli bacterium]|nr:TetR/AcrR family transcriptional regulator [Bacilli bacterium]